MKQLNFNLYNLNSYSFLFYKVITLNTQIYSRQITFIVIILWANNCIVTYLFSIYNTALCTCPLLQKTVQIFALKVSGDN